MAFRPLTARAPAVLLREAKPLKAILGHAQRLGHLQRLLESQLQPAAREHCHVASWREGSLLLIVTDGHWATRLRYQQKRLQRQLQMFDEFASLTRILFRCSRLPCSAGRPDIRWICRRMRRRPFRPRPTGSVIRGCGRHWNGWRRTLKTSPEIYLNVGADPMWEQPRSHI